MGNSTSCGQGTKKVDGVCLSTDTLSCGDGTKQVGQACLPTEILSCGKGTKQVGEVCLIDANPPTCWTNQNCDKYLGLDPCKNSTSVGEGQDICSYCPRPYSTKCTIATK